MRPKLFKTGIALYKHADWDGQNTSGWDAINQHVIVKPDEALTKTEGGVHLTDDLVDRHAMAAEAGLVVSVGDGAFKYRSDGVPYEGKKPTPGDRVSIGRYSGQLIMGQDGIAYRILSDSEIGGIYASNPS